jgi:addiction module HigA family antidote
MKRLKNVHPGEILVEEFLGPLNISQNKLARDINVPPRRINEIVHGNRSITADTDLRLSRALGTSEGFWLGLQADYDIEEKKIKLAAQLEKISLLVEGAETCLA